MVLPMNLHCFATDEQDLVFVSRLNSDSVQILRVRDWSERSVEATSSIRDGTCSQLLWCGDGFLLIGNMEGSGDDRGHQIACWRVGAGGRDATRLGNAGLRSPNGRLPRINAWTSVGGCVVLYDLQTKKLVQAKLQYAPNDIMYPYKSYTLVSSMGACELLSSGSRTKCILWIIAMLRVQLYTY